MLCNTVTMTNNPERRLQIELDLPKIKQLLYMGLILLQSSRQTHHRQDYLNQNYQFLFCVESTMVYIKKFVMCEENFQKIKVASLFYFYFLRNFAVHSKWFDVYTADTFWSMIVPK